MNNWNPVCAVLLDSQDPGAEFENALEARDYLRIMEKRCGRSGEDLEFPMIVFYSQRNTTSWHDLPF